MKLEDMVDAEMLPKLARELMRRGLVEDFLKALNGQPSQESEGFIVAYAGDAWNEYLEVTTVNVGVPAPPGSSKPGRSFDSTTFRWQIRPNEATVFSTYDEAMQMARTVTVPAHAQSVYVYRGVRVRRFLAGWEEYSVKGLGIPLQTFTVGPRGARHEA